MYVTTGEAVRYNCRTVCMRRLCVFRSGDGVEIIRPEEARKGYVEYLQSILERYEDIE